MRRAGVVRMSGRWLALTRSAGRSAAEAGQTGEFAGRERLRHLPGLEELLEKLVDALLVGAASASDALPALAVDFLVVAALPRRHREDDGLRLVEEAVVHVIDVELHLHLVDAGDH